MQGQTTTSARMRLVAPIRAAIYARVSSDQQAERHTIDSQVEALLARAAADGHEVALELRFLEAVLHGSKVWVQLRLCCMDPSSDVRDRRSVIPTVRNPDLHWG